LIALVLAAAGAAYWYYKGDAPPTYTTAEVDSGIVAPSVTASGTVNPVDTIQVGTYISGIIQELHCDFNTLVKAGQLCAKIDPRSYQSAVDQAAANLKSAKAQLAKDQANLAYTRQVYERDVRLLKRGIVSQDTMDNDQNAFEQARAVIALDEAAIEQREAALKSAQVNLDYTDIVSPVDGTVVSRNVTVGQTVAASFQTPTLFVIATDLTKMQVDTNVTESDIGGVKDGQRVVFTVAAFPHNSFNGAVIQVRQAPITLQNVVTYDVVVAVDNPELLLKPGMTATARIITDERKDVLRVPSIALRYTPGGVAAARPARADRSASSPSSPSAQVWVLRDGKPSAVPLTLGLEDGTYAEVTQGDLHEGDRVIVFETPAGVASPRATARPSLSGLR
jgi:HlyD family secretion protein